MWWWLCFVVHRLYDFISGSGGVFLEVNLTVNTLTCTGSVMLLYLCSYVHNKIFSFVIKSSLKKTRILWYQEYYTMVLKSWSHCKYNCGPIFQNIIKLLWLAIDVKHVFRELIEKGRSNRGYSRNAFWYLRNITSKLRRTDYICTGDIA
jgi:hypothetical protein